jgi:hypothetical protein
LGETNCKKRLSDEALLSQLARVLAQPFSGSDSIRIQTGLGIKKDFFAPIGMTTKRPIIPIEEKDLDETEPLRVFGLA